VLEVMQRTFATYITEDPTAVSLKEKLNEAEAALAAARNKMKLGYTDPKTGGWVVVLVVLFGFERGDSRWGG